MKNVVNENGRRSGKQKMELLLIYIQNGVQQDISLRYIFR